MKELVWTLKRWAGYRLTWRVTCWHVLSPLMPCIGRKILRVPMANNFVPSSRSQPQMNRFDTDSRRRIINEPMTVTVFRRSTFSRGVVDISAILWTRHLIRSPTFRRHFFIALIESGKVCKSWYLMGRWLGKAHRWTPRQPRPGYIFENHHLWCYSRPSWDLGVLSFRSFHLRVSLLEEHRKV